MSLASTRLVCHEGTQDTLSNTFLTLSHSRKLRSTAPSYATYHGIKFQLSWAPWRWLKLFQNCTIWVLEYACTTEIRRSQCFG